MHRRYVTLREANDMLPTVRESFFFISQLQSLVHQAFDRLDTLDCAPDTDAFDVVEEGLSEDAIAMRAQLKALVESLQDELDELEDLGCVVKDIEAGIVGWYCRHELYGDIFLSWQLGEQQVSHWHEVNTGHLERRPVSELRH